MTIAVRPLATLDDLRACEVLQEVVLGSRSRTLLRLPALASIQRSGGLLLGAWEDGVSRDTLRGILIDLIAKAEGFPARFTLHLLIHPDHRNRGLGQLLRAAERDACVADRTSLVFWWTDPLRSPEAHIAFNKLGAIAAAYRRNALGPLQDRTGEGLASDRVRVEWWLDAPRVRPILDENRHPPHRNLTLSQMHVIPRPRREVADERILSDLQDLSSKPYVLVEIPADLDRLRASDIEAARQWRLGTREAFEFLFGNGYVLVGLVHESSRSFQLFERADRGTILGRS